MINSLIYTFMLPICNPWTAGWLQMLQGLSKDPQECRASSLCPLLHACVKNGFAWLCSQQDAGRGSQSRSCNPLIPRTQGAELQVPLYWCFYHLPFLLPWYPYHIPAWLMLLFLSSQARSQPAPTLPTATKPATLEHPLFHDSVMQILEAAKAFPAGRPILTRAGRKSSIKKCWFNHTGKTVSSQWKCNQNYL